VRRLCLLVLCAGLLACEEPPTREIENAESQVETARKAGAERYAPERLRESTQALEAARQQIQKKDYKGARSSAKSATAAARAAVQGAGVARGLAKGTAETARTEVHVALDEADAVMQEALAAKVPETAFAELKPRLESVKQDLDRLDKVIAEGDPLEAREAATALKAQVADLPDAFRDARSQWEEEHPKGRRRK